MYAFLSKIIPSHFTEFIPSCRLVEKTLEPLDPERRAYRLVGGVLVERTVKEVLPSVTANRENVSPTRNYWSTVGDAPKKPSPHFYFLCCSWRKLLRHCKSDWTRSKRRRQTFKQSIICKQKLLLLASVTVGGLLNNT